jgi:general stress protein 26
MAEDDTDRVWKLIDKISICMLANWNGEELHSRPMAANSRPDENAIYFLTDVRHHKDDEIARYPRVCLAFGDASDQKYVSLSGSALVLNDKALIKDLWSVFAKAWWDSADDPNIRVLKVTPEDAQYWDSPGTTVSTIKMLAAAATGTRPNLGDNRKVAM